MARIAAIIGGGVIGGGWAARFVLMGWDVQVFDPDPGAANNLRAMVDNARRSLPGLSDVAMPPEGNLRFCDKMSDAVAGAEWIQESVPERLSLKQKTYQALQEFCDPDAVIASSTSGFTPSQLQGCATRPEQIIVAHPFNPVYLLPLVELVPSPANPSAFVDRASKALDDIGMHPLHIRTEIDAHIADRLLEAVWREALWLINDDVATTEEIDNAIRYGFGLRWAQMGLFETYRIAGGAAGMRHFIAQFGPCLELPWTKLSDVPALTDDLIAKIADQSDAQSGDRTIRDLERARDDNLVTILRGLKARNAGAGALLNAHDRRKEGRVGLPDDLSRPIRTMQRAVPLDWTDYNGHMTEARYLHAFGEATDRMMLLIGCDDAYVAAGQSFFTAETHIRHLDEVHAGTEIQITTQVLAGAGKKMHLFHRMYAGQNLLATGEHMLIHVSLETRRACEPAVRLAATLARVAQAHAALGWPDGAGKAIGVRG